MLSIKDSLMINHQILLQEFKKAKEELVFSVKIIRHPYHLLPKQLLLRLNLIYNKTINLWQSQRATIFSKAAIR